MFWAFLRWKWGLDCCFHSGELDPHAKNKHLWVASFCSELQKQAHIKHCCSFKTLGSPLGSNACSVLIAVTIRSCLHHTGACQCEKGPSWTKDWTTVCRQGQLTKTTFEHSAVFPFSLAFCSNIHSRSGSTNRGSSALACHTPITAITFWSSVTLAFTPVPGGGKHHPKVKLAKLVHKSLSTLQQLNCV